MKAMFLAALMPAAFAVLPLSTPASAIGEAPTCRGQEATHVGTPGGNLTTTPGPDVVVTNGARLVHTLNGDDVICATRSRFVHIIPGRGDDLVDATEFPGNTLETSLGEVGDDGSSGDDTYLGGDQVDQVAVWSGVNADRKKVELGGGDDQLMIERAYKGRVTAQLGAGSDNYWNDRPRPAVRVDGENGRDDLITECLGCDTAEIRLGTGVIVINDALAGRAFGFEDAQVINFKSRTVRRALVVGTGDDNRISVTACRAQARGLAGDDILSAGSIDEDACGLHRGVTLGGPGDDWMNGTLGDDVLRGGIGHDNADGRRGSDLCRAEVRTRCET